MICSRFFLPAQFGIIISMLSGCVILKNSPAPGCVVSLVPIVGGCSGKAALTNLTVMPDTNCLNISVNNCNGGVLEVQNSCDTAFNIGQYIIYPSSNLTFDIVRKNVSVDEEPSDNIFHLLETQSNFSHYIVEKDINVTFHGLLGTKAIDVSVIKTAPLCH